MRFAERLALTRHADDALLLAMAAGDAVTPHVEGCARCRARMADLDAWTRATSDDAAAVADAIFTPSRLAAQRASIARRLDAAGRSARVIAFPAGSTAPAAVAPSRVIRWAAVAAAVGLMAGAASGHLFDWHPERTAVTSTQAVAPARVPLSVIVSSTSGPSGTAAAVAALEELDEESLLEAAYDRVSVDALRAIDDITPRAREYALGAPPRRFP